VRHLLKFVLKILFTAAVAFLLQFYLSWWSVGLAGFVISFILSSSGFSSFLSGFLGVGLYWGVYAWIIDNSNDHILSSRVAELFSLPDPVLLVLITAIIGGLVGGLGALVGSQLRSIVLPVAR